MMEIGLFTKHSLHSSVLGVQLRIRGSKNIFFFVRVTHFILFVWCYAVKVIWILVGFHPCLGKCFFSAFKFTRLIAISFPRTTCALWNWDSLSKPVYAILLILILINPEYIVYAMIETGIDQNHSCLVAVQTNVKFHNLTFSPKNIQMRNSDIIGCTRSAIKALST